MSHKRAFNLRPLQSHVSASHLCCHRLVFDAQGNLFIADLNNNRIRMVNTSFVISTIVGTGVVGYVGDGGPASLAQLQRPSGFAFDSSGNLYIADSVSETILSSRAVA